VHLPLNDAIKSADVTSAALARRALDERRWVAWNIVRAAAGTGAFAALIAALGSRR